MLDLLSRTQGSALPGFLAKFFILINVISGFNTDVIFDGVTYHIQTEDKGLKTPLILSLVYVGGTILASKRVSYDDLLVSDFNEEELSAKLQRQHKLICAAVKAGRIEDLKRMTAAQNAENASHLKEKNYKPHSLNSEVAANVKVSEPKGVEKDFSQFPRQSKKSPLELSSPFDVSIPKPNEELVWEISDNAIEDLIIEDVEIVGEELFLPDEAVAVIADSIMEIPEVNAVFPKQHSKIVISLQNDKTLRGGERENLKILLNRENSTVGIDHAHLVVKILGSSFRPLIFHSKTDENGFASVDVKLPNFKEGRAAILVKAMCRGEQAEFRKEILQG